MVLGILISFISFLPADWFMLIKLFLKYSFARLAKDNQVNTNKRILKMEPSKVNTLEFFCPGNKYYRDMEPISFILGKISTLSEKSKLFYQLALVTLRKLMSSPTWVFQCLTVL